MIVRALASALTAPLAVGEAVRDPDARFEARDAIVVPGAPLAPDGRPSEVLHERLAVALVLWRGGGGARIIVSGVCTRGARRSEGEAMAEALIDAGVDPQALVVDDQAQSTRDNARRARALAPAVRTIWLATQRFHTRRAARLFRREGFAVRAAYLADGIEREDPARATRWALREYAAWLRVLVR